MKQTVWIFSYIDEGDLVIEPEFFESEAEALKWAKKFPREKYPEVHPYVRDEMPEFELSDEMRESYYWDDKMDGRL